MYKTLKEEQELNGGWGRFHSMDSKSKKKIKTTEQAMLKLYLLGMNQTDEVAKKGLDYCVYILNNLNEFPDRYEKSERFKDGVEIFIASKIALFGSSDNKYLEVVNKWKCLLLAAFGEGDYNEKNLLEEATRLNMEYGFYVSLNSLNAMELFLGNLDILPKDVQMNYLKWLKTCDQIFYSKANLKDYEYMNVYQKSDWVINLILLKSFYGFNEVFDKEIEHVKHMLKNDLGTLFSDYKVSESWRVRGNKIRDQHYYLKKVIG
jgi:hypothetical protein